MNHWAEFNENHPVLAPIFKVVLAWIGALGTVSAAQWQAVIGILVGLVTLIYTGSQLYVLWRDKIIRYRAPGSQTRTTDYSSTAPDKLK